MGTPFFRTPLTDMTGGMINCQYYSKCGDKELAMMECLEAYGVERGKKKCAILIEDFQECFTGRLQRLRINAMQWERNRQYYTGDRKEHWQKDPKDDVY